MSECILRVMAAIDCQLDMYVKKEASAEELLSADWPVGMSVGLFIVIIVEGLAHHGQYNP